MENLHLFLGYSFWYIYLSYIPYFQWSKSSPAFLQSGWDLPFSNWQHYSVDSVQGWRICRLSGQHVPALDLKRFKIFFLCLSGISCILLYSHWFSLLSTTERMLSLFLNNNDSHTAGTYKHTVKSPWAFCSSGWTMSALSASCMTEAPVIIFVDLNQVHSSMSMSPLYWRAQNWTEYTRTGHTSTE